MVFSLARQSFWHHWLVCWFGQPLPRRQPLVTVIFVVFTTRECPVTEPCGNHKKQDDQTKGDQQHIYCALLIKTADLHIAYGTLF